MNNIDKIKIFDILIKCKEKVQSEIILNLLRSNHHLNDNDLFELINIITEIDEKYKLDCIKDALNIEGIMKNGTALDIVNVICDSKSQDNAKAIINLIKNRYVSNNIHVIELAKIMNKDISSDILSIASEAAKKLSLMKDEDVVELTNIVFEAVNFNAACMTNVVVTSEEISKCPKRSYIARIMSKCDNEQRTRDIYYISKKIDELSFIFGIEESLKAIDMISKVEDNNCCYEIRKFIDEYLKCIINNEIENIAIKPTDIINIMINIKNEKILKLFSCFISSDLNFLKSNKSLELVRLIGSQDMYWKAFIGFRTVSFKEVLASKYTLDLVSLVINSKTEDQALWTQMLATNKIILSQDNPVELVKKLRDNYYDEKSSQLDKSISLKKIVTGLENGHSPNKLILRRNNIAG